MKKQVFALFTSLASLSFYGQSTFETFDNFEGLDEVSSVIVNKKMFELMTKVTIDNTDPTAVEYINLIKTLDNLKVHRTKSFVIRTQMKSAVDAYTKTVQLEELKMPSTAENLHLYIKPHKKDVKINELLLFMEGNTSEETILMSLTGSFELNEVLVLISKMKIPASETLTKLFQEKG